MKNGIPALQTFFVCLKQYIVCLHVFPQSSRWPLRLPAFVIIHDAVVNCIVLDLDLHP